MQRFVPGHSKIVIAAVLVTACDGRPGGVGEQAARRVAELPQFETISRPDTGFYQELSWSPDATHLLISVLEFTETEPGFAYHIERLGVTDGALTRLTEGPKEYWTSWHPDGSRILFTAETGQNTDIYAMDADGTNRTRLTDDPAIDTQPNWSPDGSQIVFVSDRDGTTRLWLMNADGTEARAIGEPDGEAQNPVWSPDGRRIAYYESPAPGDDWVYVIDADGTGRTRLSQGVWPSWSPDGSKILFGAPDGLSLMAPDGTGAALLLEGEAGFGRFSPDGSVVAYIARLEGDVSVSVMRADGTDFVTLLRRPAPQW